MVASTARNRTTEIRNAEARRQTKLSARSNKSGTKSKFFARNHGMVSSAGLLSGFYRTGACRFNENRGDLRSRFQWTMVIAMVSVGMMETPFNQVIHVVTVRDGSMAALGAMDVLRLVTVGSMSAVVRIGTADFNDVLVHVVAMRMVKMAVMKVVNMIAMLHRRVAAIWAMNVRMIGMSSASG